MQQQRVHYTPGRARMTPGAAGPSVAMGTELSGVRGERSRPRGRNTRRGDDFRGPASRIAGARAENRIARPRGDSGVTLNLVAAERASRKPAEPVHLTARGRWVLRSLAVSVMAFLVIGGGLLVTKQAEAIQEVRTLPVDQLIVMPGQTLWQIAGEVDATRDRGDVVRELMILNALDTPELQAGQEIFIPAA